METKEIIEGNKLIAKYLNLVYLPFSAEKVMKPGYYKTASAEPVYTSIGINLTPINYNSMDGWRLFDNRYYKYICRKHSDLKFWDSLDALIPVIQKIEQEGGIINLHSNGCTLLKGDFEGKSFDLPNWSNNTFKVIVEYLKTKYENT